MKFFVLAFAGERQVTGKGNGAATIRDVVHPIRCKAWRTICDRREPLGEADRWTLVDERGNHIDHHRAQWDQPRPSS